MLGLHTNARVPRPGQTHTPHGCTHAHTHTHKRDVTTLAYAHIHTPVHAYTRILSAVGKGVVEDGNAAAASQAGAGREKGGSPQLRALPPLHTTEGASAPSLPLGFRVQGLGSRV